MAGRYRHRLRSRGNSPASGGTPVSPPTNTVAPTVSAAGGNSVGDTVTTTNGTWTGSPTAFQRRWLRGGVEIGGEAATTYDLTTSDPGDANEITSEVRAQNAGGWSSWVESSNSVICRPYYASPPAIASGSEPWQGGVLHSDDATPSGENSEDFDWEIDGVPFGVVPDSFNVSAAWSPVGSEVGRYQDATNTGGTTETRSPVVEIEYLEGLTRAAIGDDHLRIASAPNIPSAFTILVQGIGYASDAQGCFVHWGRDATTPSRYSIYLGHASGSMQAIVYTGPNSGDTHNGPAVSGIMDGSTRWCIALRMTGTALRQTVIGATLTTSSATAVGSPAHSTAIEARLQCWIPYAATDRRTASTVEVAVLSSDVADSVLEGIYTAGLSLRKAGIYARGDLLWAGRSVDTGTEGTSITTGAEVAGETYSVVSGSARCTLGGLNVPTT